MPTMICVPCKVFLKIERNGVTFEEGFGDGQQRPYKLWMADLYRCPACDRQVIAGLGRDRVAEHYEPDYDVWREKLQPMLFVDDCPGGAIHPIPDA